MPVWNILSIQVIREGVHYVAGAAQEVSLDILRLFVCHEKNTV